MRRPVIVIPMGDPAGVGAEIAIKAMMNRSVIEKARCVIVGDARILRRALGFPNMPAAQIRVINEPADGIYESGILNVVDLKNLSPEEFAMGAINAKCGRAAYEYIACAIDMTMQGKADAVSTTPINKESLKAAGVPYIGHTEIFGALTHSAHPLTIFEVNGMRVFFLTRHMSLRAACDAITKEEIIGCVKQSWEVLHQMGVDDGVMAVAGLNPHCGEHGLFGDEEVRFVIPAVEELKEMGYRVEGPIGADSVFHQALQGRYNSVLSLYHDQGHIATKTFDFYRTISITGGLPILRTSVDHGTAFDVAGQGIASSIGMEEAILVAVKYADSFRKRAHV